MMRTMLIAVAAAALLSAGDLAAQQVDGSGWRAPSTALARATVDSRLRPDFAASPVQPVAEVPASRLSLAQVAAVGAVVGCVTGALVMGSGGDARDRAPRRFNGCILGASIGGFAGGVYGLATGR
ncbi:MAG TPA: hypothetical protein VHG08_27955 [Longimicrobium sp.]|nr:hypothetical protein [Longimicrobium sp.]